MNKVMTRLQRRSGTRPTGRRDTTRPGGSPPRTPGGTPPRTTSGARPPAGPGRTPRTRTRPTDTRPPTTPPALVPTDFFAERLLAVLTGRRPVHFMLGHTRGRAYDELAWLAERGPLRTARGPQPVVHDLGYYEVHPGALEVFARITTGNRLSALAFRLERGQDHRWRCTAVDTGGPRRPDTD